ncbi:hypothetical protein BDV93DRAFT_570833 [Ceratobasidium sp. AG-I]|nr:hypothetical protein BDV93DRAFT_570833 [Ceratobasidium sp. AG-I]
MPFLVKTKTMESALSILRSRTTTLDTTQPSNQPPRTEREGQGGVWTYLREELPSGVNSIPLGMYAFMSGYLNAISFTTAAIWCGFMTGNSVILGLALARVSLGRRREEAFAIADAQATTALVCFIIGIALARLGDLSFWSARPSSPAPTPISEKEKSRPSTDAPRSRRDTDVERNLRPSSDDVQWNESGAPTRVGTPVPFLHPFSGTSNGQVPRLVISNAQGSESSTPSPTQTMNANSPSSGAQNWQKEQKAEPKPEPAPARSRLWLLVGTLLQALLLIGAGLATLHDTAPSSSTPSASSPAATLPPTSSSPLTPNWSSAAGFTALGLASLSMGVQGVMAHRMGTGFGASVVLSSLWVELVGSPGGIRWKEYRGVRAAAVGLFIVGGLVGAVLRDASVLGTANALFVGAGIRAGIALLWVVLPNGKRRE